MDTLDTARMIESGAKELPLPSTDPILHAKHINSFQHGQLINPKFMFLRALPDIEKVVTVSMPAVSQKQARNRTPISQAQGLFLIDEKIRANNSALEQNTSIYALDWEQSSGIADANALALDTVSLRAVKKKRSKKKFKRFLGDTVLFLCSLVFLGMLGIGVALVPDVLYKLALILVFFMALSYVASVQAKHMYDAKKQLFLPVAQFVHKKKRDSSSPKDDDMQHMKLARQDTTGYLRALKKKDLKKGLPR